MTEREEIGGTVIELLLREPEIVAWLEPRADDDESDDEPPRAAYATRFQPDCSRRLRSARFNDCNLTEVRLQII